jgi:hypothetical protein
MAKDIKLSRLIVVLLRTKGKRGKARLITAALVIITEILTTKGVVLVILIIALMELVAIPAMGAKMVTAIANTSAPKSL